MGYPKISSRRQSLISVFAILFLDNFGFAALFLLFPTLILDPTFGLLPSVSSEIGRNVGFALLFAAFPLAQFFGAPLFGSLADQYGRKKTLTWTLAGTAFGYMITALAVLLQLYWLMVVGRLVAGFFGGSLAICLAITADMYTKKRARAKTFSLIAALLGLSWIVAIFVGSSFMGAQTLRSIHPSTPFWFVAILSLIALVLLRGFYRETFFAQDSTPSRSLLLPLEKKQLRVLYLVLFFWFLGFTLAVEWAAPISIEKFRVNEWAIIWLFVSLGSLWTLSAGLASRWLIEHSSLWKITLWSLFFTCLFFFFSAVADFYFYFITSYSIAGIFAAVTWGNSLSLISTGSSPAHQGKALGIGQAMLALSQFLGPFFGGIIAGFSIEPLLFVCALLIFISFLFLLVYVVRRRQRLLHE